MPETLEQRFGDLQLAYPATWEVEILSDVNGLLLMDPHIEKDWQASVLLELLRDEERRTLDAALEDLLVDRFQRRARVRPLLPVILAPLLDVGQRGAALLLPFHGGLQAQARGPEPARTPGRAGDLDAPPPAAPVRANSEVIDVNTAEVAASMALPPDSRISTAA